LIFTGPKGATPGRSNWRISVGWAAQLAAAGLPTGFHFHDLRHTGNHLAAESGASTRELMHRMGHHSTIAAALHYQHATDQRAREIAALLSEVVEARKSDAG
jgi:integrase